MKIFHIKLMIIQETSNEETNDKNKDVHILLLIPSKEKIDFKGLNYETKNKIEPKIAYQNRIDKEDGIYLEEIVFKFKEKLKKKEDDKSTKSTKYEIKFFEGDHTYIITFSLKDESFVYLPKLKTGNKCLDIVEEPIKKNIVPLYNKLNIFLEALQKKYEINKKEKLYEDTIALYEKKKTIQSFDNSIPETLQRKQKSM